MPRIPNAPVKSSSIGIGCAYLTAGSLSHHEHRLIVAAFEAGARHFDVAPQYGLGTAERVLGEALGRRRLEVSITTKVGILRPSVPSYKLTARALVAPLRNRLRKTGTLGRNLSAALLGAERVLDFTPGRIGLSLDESLRALRTDRVDLFLLHMPRRADVTDEVIAALQASKAAGKAGAIGLATDRDETAAILTDWPGQFDAVQYSWCALDAPLGLVGGEPFRITHRALVRALAPLSAWLTQAPDRSARLSHACSADLADPAVLSRALIGAALAENAGGITLVASHSIRRTRQNVEAALDPETLRLGRDLLGALRDEQDQPGPAG